MRAFLAVSALLIAVSLQADIYYDRTFSYPAWTGAFVAFESPNLDRVICTTIEGKKVWEWKTRDLRTLWTGEEGFFYLQDGRRFFRIDAATGSATRIARAERHADIVIEPLTHTAWSFDNRRYDHFSWLDPLTLRPLWRNGAVEHVIDALPDRVLVSTARRVYDDEKRSFQWSDLALRALDRATGGELWSLPVGGCCPIEHGVLIGKYLVFDRGVRDSLLVVDTESGVIVTRREAKLLSPVKYGDGTIVAIEDDPQGDHLITLRVPDLVEVDRMPAPAQENLILHIDGGVALTQGIYSIAAFDLASKQKLWEIKHQMFPTPPSAGRFYASLADAETAVLQRVDLPTGVQTPLYREPIPPPPASALRTLARARARYASAKDRKRKREERQRLPVGEELCLAFDHAFFVGLAEYLHLLPSGEVDYVDLQGGEPARFAHGRWSRSADQEYAVHFTAFAPYRTMWLENGVSVPLGTDFRFTLDGYRSYRYAQFQGMRAIVSEDIDVIHGAIDMKLDNHDEIEPPAFRLIRCSDLPALAREGH